MKVAVVGSRSLNITMLYPYLPGNLTEIVSGGAEGIDTCARNYAKEYNIKFKEFLPDYEKYGEEAQRICNLQIIDYADEVVAFWDKKSKGTKFIIDTCKARRKEITVLVPQKN